MTKIVILRKIAGHNPGSIVDLTPALQLHLDAGNAVLLDAAAPVGPSGDEELAESALLVDLDEHHEDPED